MVDERRRFRVEGHKSARVEALSSKQSVSPPEKWERGSNPLSFHFVKSRNWHHQLDAAFHDQRAIHLKVAHSTISCLKHIARSHHSFIFHHLLLSDDISVCLSLGEDRCADPDLLQFGRTSCALQFATNSRITARWFPSE